LAVVALAAAACGSAGGGADAKVGVVFSDTPEPPLDQVCELRARVCCAVELCVAGSSATARCIKVQQDACTNEIIGPLGPISDEVDYDPKKAGACLQHYLDAEGTCEALDTGNPPDDC